MKTKSVADGRFIQAILLLALILGSFLPGFATEPTVRPLTDILYVDKDADLQAIRAVAGQQTSPSTKPRYASPKIISANATEDDWDIQVFEGTIGVLAGTE
jgi:hypothetical protein